ncbi:MAG: tRNA glutamyl-Q(34) synthetase GluQRS [Deltaproteobacteria bacterium]|nr:tRNA glutamyl-Q(34) synthetase GluQRS [Deltaproteobacteria bacterium]
MIGVVEPGARRFRFAPTPSRPLHAGSALAAVFGWAACRAVRGTFLLRIEDIDRQRCRKEHEAALLDDLTWLGLDWDEPPVRQSERLALYDDALARLVARGRAYACRCSRADIRQAQSAPHLGLDGEPAEVPYPGTCRRLGLGLGDLGADGRGGMRLDVDALGAGAVVDWADGLLGPRREDVRTTSGDFLLGRPGQPTYQLAVVVDDALTGVSDVVRGRDLIGSTARQILLHRDLNASPPPRFAHHPLIVDAAGGKLSKRDGALALASLRAAGVSPERLLADLGRAIGLLSADVRRATPRDWADAIAGLGLADALHDGALHDGAFAVGAC